MLRSHSFAIYQSYSPPPLPHAHDITIYMSITYILHSLFPAPSGRCSTVGSLCCLGLRCPAELSHGRRDVSSNCRGLYCRCRAYVALRSSATGDGMSAPTSRPVLPIWPQSLPAPVGRRRRPLPIRLWSADDRTRAGLVP